MNIAIDFDGTISADEELFVDVIQLMKDAGHEVFIVTNNFAKYRPDIIEFAGKVQCMVLFAREHDKEAFVKMRGYHIDIWIDDDPEAIVGLGV
jgi:hydroxymethylpyrimidine pyrophosphatase-like HAD family hydrolase